MVTSQDSQSPSLINALEINKVKSLSPKEAAELYAYCDNKYKEALRIRLPFERQWYLNMAFYFGRQWVQWTNAASVGLNKLYEPQAPPWRVRMTINRIKPIVRTEIAKITKEHPTCFVIPATSDDEDTAAARAGEAIFEHSWRELLMHRTIRQAAFWTVLTGNGFIKDYWDNSQMDGENRGKICADSISPFHLLFPDLEELNIENQPYVIHYMAKPVQTINETFGVNLQPDTTPVGEVIEQRFLSAIGAENYKRDYVAVKEMWIKPCAKFPKGAMVTWANEEIIMLIDNWPWAHGQYPFTHFQHIPTGRFYADSVVNDLIPIQKELNRTRSQLIENKNKMSRPQLIAQKGSIDPNKVTSEPGLIITYTPGMPPPLPIPLSDIPAYVIQELDRCLGDMDDISSQHEVTKGQTPPGVSAATAISFLAEQDDTKLAGTIASIEEGVERLGRHFLSHANQFWTSERAVRVMGENGTYDTFMFNKTSLRQNTDLRVEAGSAMPISRAAKQAFITELGDKGWIPPNKILRYLGLAETGRLYEEMNIDYKHAQRENLRMQQGEQVLVNSWDNHEAHIEEHNNYRKKQQFEYLPDDIKAAFEMHVNTHLSKIGLDQGTPILPGEKPPGIPGGPPLPLGIETEELPFPDPPMG